MISRIVRLHDDVLHELGVAKDINAALRVRLGLPPRDPVKKPKPPPRKRAKRLNFEKIKVGEMKTFNLDDHKWETIQRLGYRCNRKSYPVIRFGFWRDGDYAYVTRLR